MKKILLFAAIVAAGLSSCSKESVVDTQINQEGGAISFGSYATKGNPFASNNEFISEGGTAGFGVSAFISTATNVAYLGGLTEGTQIVQSSNIWDYKVESEVRYWPVNSETLNFFAYAPYAHSSITKKAFSNTGVVLNVTIPAEASQADIMFAEAKTVSTPDPIKTQSLEFKHALTQIKFAARTDTEGLFVDIEANGIELNKINSVGIFTSSAVATNNGWSALGTPANYIVTSAAMTAGYDNDDTTPTVQDYAKIGTDDNTLMLIPQVLVAAEYDETTSEIKAGDDGAYATVSCKIYQKLDDGTKVYQIGSDSAFGKVIVPISSKISNSGDELWNRAKIVTYNLLIGAGNLLHPIMFDTTVENWTEAANSGDWANNK